VNGINEHATKRSGERVVIAQNLGQLSYKQTAISTAWPCISSKSFARRTGKGL
jgi:hypothetical protein